MRTRPLVDMTMTPQARPKKRTFAVKDTSLSRSNETFHRFTGGRQPSWLSSVVLSSNAGERASIPKTSLTTPTSLTKPSAQVLPTVISHVEGDASVAEDTTISAQQSSRPNSESAAVIESPTMPHAQTDSELCAADCAALTTNSEPMDIDTDLHNLVSPLSNTQISAQAPSYIQHRQGFTDRMTIEARSVSRGLQSTDNVAQPALTTNAIFSTERVTALGNVGQSITRQVYPQQPQQPQQYQKNQVQFSPTIITSNTTSHPKQSDHTPVSNAHTHPRSTESTQKTVPASPINTQPPFTGHAYFLTDTMLGERRNMNPEEMAIVTYFTQSQPSTSPYSKDNVQNQFQHLYTFFASNHTTGFAHSRLTMVRAAIFHQDHSFLLLQQVICIYTESSVMWPSVLNDAKALLFLQDVLGREKMPVAISAAFINFPTTLAFFTSEHAPIYNWMIQNLSIMFKTIAKTWQRVYDICMQRRYPPTVKEFLIVLGIPSVVLMECCLLMIMRKLWQGDQSFMTLVTSKALEIFRHNLSSVRACGRSIRAIITVDERPFRQAFHQLDMDMNAIPCPPNNVSAQILAQPHQNMAAGGNHTVYNSQNLQHGSSDATVSPVLQVYVPPESARIQAQPTAQAWSQAVPTVLSNHDESVKPGSLFYPASGAKISQLRVPMPGRTALHQLHLQEPPRRLLEDGHAVQRPYYQYPNDHKRLSCVLDSGRPNLFFRFEVSKIEISQLPVNSMLPSLQCAALIALDLKPDSIQYRLRCFHQTRPDKTDFPLWLTLRMNAQRLEVRRKIHHGTDLPIELTSLIREGTNELYASMTLKTGDPKADGWIIVIETVVLKSEAEIRAMVTSHALQEQEVLDSMIANLKAQDQSDAADDDDDIVMVSQNLRIGVTDPMTRGLIGDCPVRSATCKHADCFDLGTFLESRPRVKPKIADPYKIWNIVEANLTECDRWKCPILGCDADASPPKLRLDLWMQKVQQQLVGREDGNECAVVVEKDGSWKIDERKKF